MGRFLLWRRRDKLRGVVESHFWSLTRYRIGRHFLGLDYADNIIFFPAYRRKTWGGWAAVTLGAANTGYLTSDTSAANVLEDGYPLHWRASTKLQLFIAEEKKVWGKQKEEEFFRRAADRVAAANGGNDLNCNNNNNNNLANAEKRDKNDIYDADQFRDALTIKCTSPGFAKRHLRLSRMKTVMYKALYFYIWGIAISVVLQAYLLFRGWLNPPARQGLKNIEDHVLHVPMVVFSFGISCVAWMTEKLKPIFSTLYVFVGAYLPHVDWDVILPQALLTRAQQLTETNEKMTPQAPARCEVVRRKNVEKEINPLWSRTLLFLFCIFLFICVL